MKSRLSIFVATLLATSLSAEVLNFSTLYGLALDNTNNIKSLIYQSEADKERIDEERGQLYPQININGSYKKSEYRSNPGKKLTKQGLISGGVSVHQKIYNDEVLSRIDLQKARSYYSDIKVEKEKAQLAQRVFEAYLDLLKSHKKIELLESNIEYSKSKLDEIQKRYELRLANKMDYYQMKVEYSSSMIELDKEKQYFEVYRLRLKQFIGDVEFDLPDISSDSSISILANEMRDDIIRDADIENSINIKEARAALDISRQELSLARSGYLPYVSFDAAYNKYDTDTPTVDAPYDSTRFAMIGINYPLFSGFSTSSKVQAASLTLKAAKEDLEGTRKDIDARYKEYLAIFDASSKSVTMYKDAINSAELYLESVSQGYEYGLKSLIDLNDAKNRLNESKYKYIDNLHQMVSSYIGVLIIADNFSELNKLDSLIGE